MDYWNNYRHQDFGGREFLKHNNLSGEYFDRVYLKFVDIPTDSIFGEHKLKTVVFLTKEESGKCK